MSKKKIVGIIASSIVGGTAIVTWIMKKKAKKTTYKAESIEAIPTRKMGFYEKYVKRAIDVVCASAAIICFSPLYIGVAILVKFKLGSPVLFTQDRPGLIGEDGKETIFKMYKFRSMYADAEERKKELMAQNEMNGLMFKMEDDPRVTKVGKFIRRTSIDELPQFFDVLRGDMSLVGTRPPTVDEYKQYESHHKRRLSMKPGITGLWQVSGRSDIEDFEEVVKLDVAYIDNWSLWGDVKILFKTIYVVFAGKGAK